MRQSRSSRAIPEGPSSCWAPSLRPACRGRSPERQVRSARGKSAPTLIPNQGRPSAWRATARPHCWTAASPRFPVSPFSVAICASRSLARASARCGCSAADPSRWRISRGGGSSPPRSGRRQCVVRRGRRRERLRVPVRPLLRILPAFPARFRRWALASCGYFGCIARAGRGGREGAWFHPNPRRRPRRVAGTPGLPVTSSGTAGVHHRNLPPRGREAARAGPAPDGSDAGGNNTPSASADASPGLGGSGEKSGGARGGCTTACDVNATTHPVAPNLGCIVLSFLSDPG